MPAGITLALLLFAIVGCSAKMVVSEIEHPNDLKAGSAVDGIPFRTSKRFIAEIYEKRTTGYERVAETPVTLPDPDRLYLLGFTAHMLSNATIDLRLNPDNTIQVVSLKSEQQGTAALTEAGTQLQNVTNSLQAKTKAEETARSGKEDASLAAKVAKAAADLAVLEAKLAHDKPGASADDLLKADQAADIAMAKAQIAARRAGIPPYQW